MAMLDASYNNRDQRKIMCVFLHHLEISTKEWKLKQLAAIL